MSAAFAADDGFGVAGVVEDARGAVRGWAGAVVGEGEEVELEEDAVVSLGFGGFSFIFWGGCGFVLGGENG